ncbi:MAG: CRTAC1 family protein [bacterium]|nr:CRTAC1 family protein [bacterium]
MTRSTHMCFSALVALSATLAFSPPVRSQDSELVRVPEDMGEASLPARKAAQLATLPRFKVFHGFSFTDRREQSGITFRHQMVDDIGIRYKPVHYDHGNGIAAADVDGDGLEDLYFLTQLGTNELWRNLGNGKFENITQAAGVAMVDRVSVTASFADVDNDGDADLFVTTVRKGNALFENDGKGRFRDITSESGLGYVGHSSGGLFFDYDNDGLLDLFLTNIGVYTSDEQGRGGYYVGLQDAFQGYVLPTRAERSILYKNLGNRRFKDVSEESLLIDRSWSGDASATDLNGDGFQDLFVLNMHGADHYYENVKGKFFVDKTAKLFPKTPPGSMGVKFFDWNHDGLLDLLLTDMHADMIENIGPEREKLKSRVPGDLTGLENSIFGNAFFENTGSGFREISDQIGVENYWPWGVSVDDLNADGWDDVFIAASMNYPFRYGINSLLLNNRGETFLDSEFIVGIEPRKGELVLPWFEIDCSGTGEGAYEDPLEGWKAFSEPGAGKKKEGEAIPGKTTEAAGRPECKDRSGKVTILGSRGTRSSVIFDLEGDGDLDIVTTEFFDRPQVLTSDLAEKKEIHFLKVKLVGTASNRDGLGTKVTVFSGGRSHVKVHDGKSGYLSQSLLPLYFGLDDRVEVERIEILWPSGRQQVVTAPEVDTVVEIVEPKAE